MRAVPIALTLVVFAVNAQTIASVDLAASAKAAAPVSFRPSTAGSGMADDNLIWNSVLQRDLAAPASGRLSLTQALKGLGVFMTRNFIDFGIELDGSKPEPLVRLRPVKPHTVRALLEMIMPQAPDYDFAIVSPHLVSVWPRGAKGDPADLLNVRVAQFDVEGVQAGLLLTWPEIHIAELRPPQDKQRIDMFIGAAGIGALITLHLTNLTVRDVFNAVSVATEKTAREDVPLGWECSQAANNNVPHCILFSTVPPNWKQVRSLMPAP